MNKIKENRVFSYIIITIICILATFAAIFTYTALNFEWWIRLLIADVVATALTFVFSVIFSNASVYDPYWSVQPIVILAALAVGRALTPIRVMLLFAVCFWGIPLADGRQSAKPEFDKYKSETRMLLPIRKFR